MWVRHAVLSWYAFDRALVWRAKLDCVPYYSKVDTMVHIEYGTRSGLYLSLSYLISSHLISSNPSHPISHRYPTSQKRESNLI